MNNKRDAKQIIVIPHGIDCCHDTIDTKAPEKIRLFFSGISESITSLKNKR